MYQEDYRALRNTRPPAGQALTDAEQERLFDCARREPRWLFAYVAATLAFFCGLRACEIKGLQWKHIDLGSRRLQVRRSKTPAGWRDPTLNNACVVALTQLHAQAAALGFDDRDHFVFPWHGRDKKIDPKRAMTSWRSAWRSLRAAAGLPHVRFHDGRHTALTRLAEAAQPDWVIQAQIGHVSPAMMKTYSHVRRQALDEAAAALEPAFDFQQREQEFATDTESPDADRAASQSTSQSGELEQEVAEMLSEIGSPHWTISATG